MVIVRTFLVVVVARNWELHQMDLHNAFLHGDLHEEVYMQMPLGFQSDKPGIFLSQRKYALDIISEVGLLGAKPATFPLEQNHNLALTDGPLLSDPERYRRLQPQERHWEAALQVVHYLKGNPGQGILLRSDCDLHLYAWCDSDWRLDYNNDKDNSGDNHNDKD
ncbi:PREDICTED: uncharacterized protein LOC104609797 [Nelumbo nucifera]|uniref:Uncharacterized protein LOC104609797 n=1 Tax=Nelumbo nucifera TaxID=4432 RepID=A0A1U8B4Z1_NELNU|nr:PREDICTED: uncharacterized protein LOC104609797 [Nelumbo nucifera]